jgi:amidase
MPANRDDLAHLDAIAQATLVRDGEITALELVEAAIERIERVNPLINAVIGDRFDAARSEVRAGLRTGPFSGVPTLLKDLGATMAGEPYHAGTRVLKNLGYVATEDSAVVRRLRDAGLAVLGRTNTPEFGNSMTTEPMSYGPSRNPWNLEHSTGGSSGGSAAAVAAGLVAAAHAGDGGGSIRIPASECGLVGLKASRGRISDAPNADVWMGAATNGMITRTVRDAAAFIDVLAGYEPGDPYSAPPFERPLLSEVGVDPGRLRIGFLDRPAVEDLPTDPDCQAAVQEALRVLESLGHAVEPSFPDALTDAEQGRRFVNVVVANTAADVADLERIAGHPMGDEDLEPDDLRMAELGRGVSAAAYLENVAWVRAWCRRVVSWWCGPWNDRGFDVLVTPTIAKPPPALGVLSGPGSGRRFREYLQFTSQFNLSGQPAISLPLHWTGSGLPVGVQFVAAPNREDLLIRLSAQLEAAMPWHDRRPPIHA